MPFNMKVTGHDNLAHFSFTYTLIALREEKNRVNWRLFLKRKLLLKGTLNIYALDKRYDLQQLLENE